MLDFHTPGIEDKQWIDPILAAAPTRACEYNFTAIYLWGGSFQKKIARMEDRLIMRLLEGPETRYLFPIGTGPLEPVIQAMAQDAAASGSKRLRIICVPQEFCDELERAMPGRFRFEPDRSAFDYIYTIDRLADLKGKKLHAKRNHIHRFEENHPGWTFEPLTQENLQECVEMDNAWFRQRDNEADADEKIELGYENDAVHNALTNFETLGLTGGLIRAEGQVAAFSLGGRLGNDTFDIHFEKAFGEIQGAYAVINRELARCIRSIYPDIVYLNREDDLGLEGLRKAKMSYYPDILLEKYTACWEE